jgi:hypothetical protein
MSQRNPLRIDYIGVVKQKKEDMTRSHTIADNNDFNAFRHTNDITKNIVSHVS